MFLSDLKLAKHKKKNIKTLNKYQLISVSSIIFEFMETLVNNKIVSFSYQKNKLLIGTKLKAMKSMLAAHEKLF